jgi:hypothetical protein
MNILRCTIRLGSFLLLVACSEEPPPISVGEFMENPRLLEATMVRCAQNRSESRYLVECVNARDAVNRIEAVAEKQRREEFEKQSERKRQALRRTQEAAAEARRRALEAQRRREEEHYLGIFDQPPANSGDSSSAPGPEPIGAGPADPADNAPTAIVEPRPAPMDSSSPVEENAEAPATDLGAIREELKRRQETGN